jgi:hypothetical protein
MFGHSSQRHDTAPATPSDPSTDCPDLAPADLPQRTAESMSWALLRAVEFEQLAAILAIKAGGGNPRDAARSLQGSVNRAAALVPRGCIRAWSRLRHGWRCAGQAPMHGRRSDDDGVSRSR